MESHKEYHKNILFFKKRFQTLSNLTKSKAIKLIFYVIVKVYTVCYILCFYSYSIVEIPILQNLI